jgi:tetratricopeptide (TPR) repeat protein
MEGEKVKCPKCGAENPIYIEESNSYICRKEECEHKFTLEAKSHPKNIFMSYGHDEYEKLALKIKEDLEKGGHEVWFDRSELKVGRDWEIAIENGLKGTEIVIVMMTDHSMRRPDGYCLNELSMAFTLRKTILPIMAEECTPPVSIHRIQYLDFREWPCTDERYKEKFAQILDVIEGRLLSFDGSHSFLLNKLEPLDFKAEIDKHIKNFKGREWIFEEIKEWLYSKSDSRIFFLTGKPGVGKTAISAMLCYRFPEVKAFHLVMFDDVRKSDALECVLSLAYQLSTQILDYADKLLEINFERIREKNARTVFDELIIQPLFKIKPPSKPILIVIDALDEAKKGDENVLVSFISNAFNLTPPWLKLFITSRPEPDILNSLASLKPYRLNTEDSRNLTDIREYLEEKLGELFSDKDTSEALEIILERSEGVFLYIQEVLNELKLERLDLDKPGDFPKGLKEVYRNFFKRQFPVIDDYNTYQRPLLELITAAVEPLRIKEIRDILSWDDYIEKECIDPLSSFLEINDGIVKLFHKSLTEWLIDKQTGKDFFISIIKGNKELTEYGWRKYNSGINKIPEYFMNHLYHHLTTSERIEDAVELISDSQYVSKIKMTEIRGFTDLHKYLYYGALYFRIRPNEAIECYDKALEIDPEHIFTWISKGGILISLNKYQKAIECFDKALEIDPEHIQTWVDKGNALISLKHHQKAIECYDKALEIDPENLYAWFNKGNALDDLNKYQRAIECFDKALEIDPAYNSAWFNKGNGLISLKHHQKAIECYDKALEIDPEDSSTWFNKGNALSTLNKHQEAIECYDKALEIDPEDLSTWFNKGNALISLKHHQKAIECYNKVLEIDPENSSAWVNKGNALNNLNKYQNAIECYNKVLKIEPETTGVLDNKGRALSKLNRYEEAIECYNKALKLDLNNPIIWYNKACVESVHNNKGKSVESLKKAIDLDKNFVDFAITDEDFDNIRKTKEFQDLLSKEEK